MRRTNYLLSAAILRPSDLKITTSQLVPELKLHLLTPTGKYLSETLLFAEHGENMLCTKIILNVRNNFCKQHVLSRVELGIFMY